MRVVERILGDFMTAEMMIGQTGVQMRWRAGFCGAGLHGPRFFHRAGTAGRKGLGYSRTVTKKYGRKETGAGAAT
ncbi:MAG TPA: hypothetical protein VFJ52_13850 [Terriglobia bacterium]|nr:hypothetical protein [Terriglobia bacterium]